MSMIAAALTPPAKPAPQFEDAAQQRATATLGMWIFLATEVLFFGALFLAYTVYRLAYPHAFAAAAQHTLLLAGTVNTAVLLCSSYLMALAVRAAGLQRRWQTFGLLLLTAVLAAAFLGIKGFEYAHEIREGLWPGPHFRIDSVADLPHAQLFFCLYFILTGLHALHVTIGLVLIGVFAFRAIGTTQPARFATAVELLGLYWHFVDLVWIFLFPLIYLPGRHL